MATYRLNILRKAVKDIQKLGPSVAQLIWREIEKLSEDPRPRSSKKLRAASNFYRLRVREWRVIYEINDAARVVTVVHVFHRRDAYRNL